MIIAVLIESVCDRFASNRGVDQPHPEEDRDLENYCQEDDRDDFTHEDGILPLLNPV